MYRRFLGKEPFPKDINWKRFLTEVVEVSRVEYETQGVKDFVKDEFFDSSFLPPCQIEVLDSGREVVWLVVHDDNLKDMEFKIHKNVESYGESEFARKYALNLPEDFLKSTASSHYYLHVFTKGLSFNPFSGGPKEIAGEISDSLSRWTIHKMRENQVNVIQDSTSGLRRGIARLGQKDMRDSLETFTNKIDEALVEIRRSQKIDKALAEHEKKLSTVEKDILGVRRLVGASQEFQDWRILVSDVEDLKSRPHVSKESFESEVKRLDQKVDALKEIKFWSKRTIVDIILAVVATASTMIAALLATGIIHL